MQSWPGSNAFFSPKSLVLRYGAVAPVAGAQAHSPQIVIAVPQFPTPKNVKTEGGETGVIGIQIAQQIVVGPAHEPGDLSDGPERPEALHAHRGRRPALSQLGKIGAGALVTGYVQARDDGRIQVVCYLYDLKQKREMTRKGFVVAPTEWKRAAHRCAGAFFTAVTKRPGHFDSRIAYVAETGSRTSPQSSAWRS